MLTLHHSASYRKWSGGTICRSREKQGQLLRNALRSPLALGRDRLAGQQCRRYKPSKGLRLYAAWSSADDHVVRAGCQPVGVCKTRKRKANHFRRHVGSRIVNFVPLPTSLCTSIVP